MFSDEEVSVFQEELEEKMQVINDNILLLEQQQATPEVIQEIFRAAHTIKGSSAVMGYDTMTELTHEIESLFDDVRHNRLAITPGLVDVLFEAMDTLTELKEVIIGGNTDSGVDISGVLNKIAGVRGNAAGHEAAARAIDCGETPVPTADTVGCATGQLPPLPEVEMDESTNDVAREAELQGYNTYQMQVRLAADCQMKEVRLFLLMETLEQAGEVIKTNPPAEDIQNGQVDAGIALLIITEWDMDQLKNLALSVAEIDAVEIKLIEPAKVGPEDHSPGDKGRCTGGVAAGEGDGGAKEASPMPGREKKMIKTVRVDVEKLDTLMNLVGELVIDRTRLERFVQVFENNYASDELLEDILEISSHLGQITTDLQDEIMKARMLPVAQVFNRFPRMVRDVAHKLNKEVEFVVEGKETELDRNVIEVIGDPLIHLLRNAIDHGIEEPDERRRLGKPPRALLQLKASYVESHIVITVEDDGRGIDVQAVKDKALRNGLISQEQHRHMSDRDAMDLIFQPGFSTVAEDSVSDISGRGVGMDIVRTQIENINGIVDYVTWPGRGTRFSIKLPLTLAIIRALMIDHGGRTYAFPLTYVVEILQLSSAEIKKVRHAEVIMVRGNVYPLKRLEDIFNLEHPGREEDRIFVVIVGSGERKIGIVVDQLLGEQEIVIKSLGSYLGQVEGLAGATILGDGKVALIIDVRSLLRNMGAEEALVHAAAH